MQAHGASSGKHAMTAAERSAAAAEVERRRRELLSALARMDAHSPTPTPVPTSSERNGRRGHGAGGHGGGVPAPPSPPNPSLPPGVGKEDNNQRGVSGSTASSASSPHLSAAAATTTTTTPLMHSRAAAATTFTTSGRPLILSANSRRLPSVFAEQQHTVRLMENAMGNVGGTLHKLTYDLSRAADIQLPDETAAAVEENDRAFTDQLAVRASQSRSLGGSAAAAAGNGAFLPYQLRGGRLHSDWLTKLQRARAAAADECLDDAQSVVDYAGDAEVPRLVKGRTLHEELAAMRDSLEKMVWCATAMRVDVSGNPADGFLPGSAGSSKRGEGRDAALYGNDSGSKPPTARAAVSYGDAGAFGVPWWASALRTRELKAHAIRLNYHARRALRWSWRCREHLLLQSAFLNHHAAKCHEDLVRLQGKLASFSQRFTDSEASSAAMQRETIELQQKLVDAGGRKGELQEALVARAHAEGLIGEQDAEPLNAELALLLANHVWPTELRGDVAVVGQWLRTEQVSLA